MLCDDLEQPIAESMIRIFALACPGAPRINVFPTAKKCCGDDVADA